MKHHLSALARLALTAALLAACGDDDSPAAATDDTTVAQDAAADTGGPGDTASPSDPGVTPDPGGGGDDGPPEDHGGEDVPSPPDTGPPMLIEPGDPGPSDVAFTVHSQQDVHPISPFVYGTNQPQWDTRDQYLRFGRAGGNRWTAYNWENNASNAGSDWFHQNDGYLGGGDVPGEAVRMRVEPAHAVGAAFLVTVPMVGYVSADKDGDGDVNQTPDYLDVRFHVSVPAKGAAFADPPDLGDDMVYQDEFVAWLEATFPYAATDPARRIFYSFDNEPDLWSGTHARIHPEPAGYAELRDKTIAYGTAIKAVAPSALTFGPVSYGFNGYVNLQNAPDADGHFLSWYLAELKAHEDESGQRVLDVLDLHWYPEARGGGVRITTDDSAPAIAEARMQAPRSLWDPDYVETSWIADYLGGQPIALLPDLQGRIDANYPDTRLAFTEYYYGGGAHISGGIAQADVLGIFGREGVFAASLWHLGDTDDRYIHGAFALFTSYDGQGAGFGDTSIHAATADEAATSVYASVDAGAPGRMVIVAINKTDAPLDAGIQIHHTESLSTATPWVIDQASHVPAAGAPIALPATNALVYTMPALSVTTLVLE